MRTRALIAMFAMAASAAWAGTGLMTGFVEVVLDRLEAGRLYNVTTLGEQEFVVTNTSDRALTIVVSPEGETPASVVPGYEPIPDVSWLTVRPGRFTLAAGEAKALQVLLKVPQDRTLSGRHFQAAVFARTVDGLLAVGLRSRLRFSVGADRPAVAAKASPRAALRLETDESRWTAAAGRETALPAVKVTNHGTAAAEVRLRSVYHAGERPADCAPTPDPGFLGLETESLRLAPGESREVKAFCRIPAGAAYKGRTYAFMLRAEADAAEAPASAAFYVRVKGGAR